MPTRFIPTRLEDLIGDVLIVSPSNGQVLGWNSTVGAWENQNQSGGSPGGSSGQLQYNDGGSFAGLSNMTVDANGQITLSALGPTDAPLTIKGSVSQTGDLQDWTDNNGDVLASVNHAGSATFTTSVTIDGGIQGNVSLTVSGGAISLPALATTGYITWANGYGMLSGNDSAVAISAAGAVPVEIGSGSNVGLCGSGSFGGGSQVVFLANAATAPAASNPSGGGILYAADGALYWLGSSGTSTKIASA